MNAVSRFRRVLAIVALGCAITGVAGVANAAVPTIPTMRDAWVSDVGKVSLRWDASTDASAHAIAYDIYRDVIPISSATIASRSLSPIVTNYVGLTAQLNAAASEATQSYVWYYAVVARDNQATPLMSGPSLSISPNVHGYRTDSNVITCNRCHSTHGAYQIPYKSKELCYTCHGNTTAGSAQAAKSSKNVQASFYDYSGQIAGSKHRNQYMIDNNKNCSACHSPHRSSYFYDSSGTYQATSSFRMMLRITYGTSLYAYVSNNAAPATNNEACLGCHGATMVFDGKTITGSTSIALAGGPSAYANTGGDHNTAGYSASAHGNATIYSNDYPATSPGVQCEVCHDNHGSATTRLIDYRRSRTTDANANKQAGLCFKCHSATSTETNVAAGYAKPFAWNGRDVKAEFSRVSHHPAYTTTGSWVPTVNDTFSQTTLAEFNTDTLSNAQTTNTSGGEISLAQYTTTITPPRSIMVYGSQGSTTVFNGYDPATATWSTAPASKSFSPGTGSSAFLLNNKAYVTRGNGSPAQDVYNPTTDSWAAGQTLPTGIGVAGDSTVNTSAADTCVYYSAGGSSSSIAWWDFSGAATGSMTFRTGSTARTLGIGSAIAYAPGANRLFVIYQNGTAGDGRLYYLGSPARTTGNADFTQGVQVVSDTSTRYNRMAYFKSGGIEYLLVLGRDTTDSRDTIVVSSLAGTPVKTDLNVDPFAGWSTGDGVSLQWDGGDYMYAIRGGGGSDFRRALIPSNPITGSWTWETLSNSFPQDAGSSISAGLIQPADVTGQAYRTSGTATTPDILPYTSAHSWGTVTWNESEPAGTTLSVTVQGWNGSSWTALASAVNASPISLSAFTTAAYPRIRLVANLSTTDNQLSPTLTDWAATSIYDVYVTGSGSLTCVNCHNVHYNGRGTAGTAWQMVRAALPSNTKTNYTGTPTQFCLECHGGAAPEATITASVLVPYAPGFRSLTSSPFFPGWNKSASSVEFAASGHKSTTISKLTDQFGCDTCHDPHGSDNKRLTALTASGGTTGSNHLNSTRVNTTAYTEEQLCYACHDNRRTGMCASPGCHQVSLSFLDVRSAFTLAYRHPVATGGRHADTETAAGLGSSNRHAECADCHDPHAARSGLHTETSSNAGEVLRGAVGIKPTAAWPANGVAVPAAGWTTERMTGETTDYEAYVCLKCHSSYSGQPFSVTSGSGTYTSTDLSTEFNPSNFGEHNVLGQSVGMETSFTFKNDAGTTVTRTWDLPDPASVIFDTTPVMWGYNSGMTCTSCHSNSTAAAKGPHGSSVKYMIDPAYPTQWELAVGDNPDTSGDQSTYLTTICNKCHANDYVNMNGAHKYTKHFRGSYTGGGSGGGKCIACHVKIPHGWKRPRLLGYRSDPANYSSLSIVAVLDKNIADAEASESSSGWDKANCITSGCDSHSTSKQGGSTYWP